MEVQHERCAGLDVHKETVVVCVRVQSGKKATREVKTFGTTTTDLLAMSDWMTAEGVTHVAMEATGVYWRPVWHVLDSHFEQLLANAQHIKNVPGRKTDVKDAEWIADLLAHGLIRGSFIPDSTSQQLRDLTRTRKQLTQERTRHVQRIQKTLEDANVKVESVITDIMGMSGRAFLDAMIAGETNPEKLADLASPRLKASRKQIVEALRGFVKPQHRFMLRVHLKLIASLEEAITDMECEVAALLEPFREQVALLKTMPGLSDNSAHVVLAEIGMDMSRFPTAEHLVSWAGLCPRCDESAGKRRSTRIRHGNRWLKALLVQCAWAAVRKKDSHFKAMFHRIKARQGSKKAIVAVAAEMLRSAWHMLKKREPYADPAKTPARPDRRDREARRLVKKLKSLGYDAEIKLAA
jgi:transposase